MPHSKYGAARTRDKFDLGSQVSSPGVKKYGEKLLLHPVTPPSATPIGCNFGWVTQYVELADVDVIVWK